MTWAYCPDCGASLLRAQKCLCGWPHGRSMSEPIRYPKQPTKDHVDLAERHLVALQLIKKLKGQIKKMRERYADAVQIFIIAKGDPYYDGKDVADYLRSLEIQD